MIDIETEKALIQEHLDKGNYHAAINIAISAMNDCRKHDKQDGVDEFIGIMRSIIDAMDGEFGSK